MSARAMRIKKEVRALFWPWCLVMIGGALPAIVHTSFAKNMNALSFFFGIPLLATLSFGTEFHHRTFSLWLALPASRMQLWCEKMSVMFVAVLSAGLVAATAMFVFSLPEMELTYKVAAGAYVLIAMASATFWTLAARSTVGGFALISCIFYIFYLFVGEIENLPRSQVAVWSVSAPAVAISGFSICFAGLMLWLGARKLVRLQVTGGSGGEDLLMAGPAVMPEAAAEWFRCRPTGVFLNLLRKELRLLRPVWLIELVVVLYIASLATLRLLPSPPALFPHTVLQWVLLGPVGAVCIGLAGLAGILSLGEERRSGTHAWHMTLPISARRQWTIKLLVAVLTGLACAVLLPLLTMILAGSLFGSPLMFVDLSFLPDWLILYPLLTFACFWCGCAANGPVRAAIWVFPVTSVVLYAAYVGIWLGEELARRTGTLRDIVVSSLHLSPLAFTTVTDLARTRALWLFVPTLLFALLQSYQLFRMQPDDSVLRMLRCVLPVAAVTILWTFSVSAGFVSSRWEPFDETRHALDRFQPGAAKLELSGEDLGKGAALTRLTQRWLRGSSIAVTSNRSYLSGYLATIRLAGGLECKLTVARSGVTAAACVPPGP